MENVQNRFHDLPQGDDARKPDVANDDPWTDDFARLSDDPEVRVRVGRLIANAAKRPAKRTSESPAKVSSKRHNRGL
jgi:hypothetical protein